MQPNINPSLPPPFWQLDPVGQFQPLCKDILELDPEVKRCFVYGTPGQKQQGIDLLAETLDLAIWVVAQCKCYKQFDEKDIEKACNEFLAHLSYWQEQGVQRFVLMVACPVERVQAVRQRMVERQRFMQYSIAFDLWDGYELRDRLSAHRNIAERYIQSAEIVDNICGRHSTEPDLTVSDTAIFLEQIEAAMREPMKYRSMIENVLLEEARRVWKLMSTESADCPFVLQPSDTAACIRCLESMESGSERFVKMLAALVRYDAEGYFASAVGRALSLLGQDPREGVPSYTQEILGVRLYPLALATYAMCLVASEWSRQEYVKQLGLLGWKSPPHERQFDRAVKALQACTWANNYYQTRKTEYKRSLDAHARATKDALSEWIGYLCFGDWESLWWKSEFLLALVYLDVPSDWVLHGSYLYFWGAAQVLPEFLKNGDAFLRSCFPDIEARLARFDEAAPNTKSWQVPSSMGFQGGALAAFKGGAA